MPCYDYEEVSEISTDPNDMHFKQLADKVRYFKEDEKGGASMCKVMEDMREETKIESAVNLLKLEYSVYCEIHARSLYMW